MQFPFSIFPLIFCSNLKSRFSVFFKFCTILSLISAFEIDVNKWLLRNKFETMHTGGAGDGGKDIVATKIIDKEVKTFLFECKCWKDKVGISVLRKLVGTLTDYPPDTLGGVITTSTFTRDAIEYAEKKSLLLIDGDKLVKLSFLN